MNIDHLQESIETLMRCKAERLRTQDIQKTQTAIIKEALGEDEIGEIDGVTVVTWKHGKTHRLNADALKAEMPEVHAKFYELHTIRRFLVSRSTAIPVPKPDSAHIGEVPF